MAAAGAVQVIEASSPAWVWPIRIGDYDRSGALSSIEREALTHELAHAPAGERSARAVLETLHGVERLVAPLDDALAAIDGSAGYEHRVKLMVLRQCALLGSAFWAWDQATWCKILGTTQQAFYAAHLPRPSCGGERHILIAVAYLLRCFTDIPALGEVQRVGLAEKIFGRQRVAHALQRVQAVSAGWGYRPRSSALLSLVAELFLIDQRPELESLSAQRIESARTRWRDSNSRSSLYFQLARVLVALGVLAGEPKARERTDRGLAHDARIAGIAPDWVVMVERWEATSTLIARSRAHLRDALLKAGRWLHATHPEVTQADQWTRELAAEYVAAVSRMRVGDYVFKTCGIAHLLGKPATARSKDFFLSAMRRLFADGQEWEWIARRFDPFRAFATPRSIKALIGPSPRTIADELWAKLLWAGLNLSIADLPSHGSAPTSHQSASGATLRNGGFYPLQMLQALSVVWLFAGLRSHEIVRLRVGCARTQPSLPTSPEAASCWLLDVPVHKTGTAMTKPIDPIVGEAIAAWEAVRPHQPPCHDPKTGESAQFLFSYRARALPSAYLNHGLIPILCRKAGIPRADARGSISSHRARSTIASQLYNARSPMTLFELQAWLGHRSPASTQHYVAFTPTRLARAYSEAHYFQRNLEIPLTDDEKAAVDGDAQAIERLLNRLATTPTPDRPVDASSKKADQG